MFPSAANITPGEHSEDPPRSTDSWLQSLSYQSQPSQASQIKKALERDKKHRSKRHRKRSHDLQIDVPAKEKALAPDFYYIDTHCNPYIFKYGCIYEGEVPKFYQSVNTSILGFNGTLCLRHFDPIAIKQEVKRNRSGRYFSKKNRLRLAQPAISVNSATQSKDDIRKPYIIFPDGAIPPTCETLAARRSEHLQKIADLNRAVYATPNNPKSWLELSQMQLLNEESDNREPLERRCFLALERQLTILERAVQKNSGNLRLRLLLIAMYEYATELITSGVCRTTTSTPSSLAVMESLQQKDKVAREWYDLVRVCPQFVNVWRGYLAHFRSRFALGSFGTEARPTSAFGRIDGIYRRAIDTLSGLVAGRILSHQPTEDTADQTIDLLAEYCQWLSHTGFTERAFSIWQAAVEFVCFCPSHLSSRQLVSAVERRSEFMRFWTAEDRGAVFGVPGALGWAVWCSGKRQAISKTAQDAMITIDTPLRELEENWNPSSLNSSIRWNRICKVWNDVSEDAEDALLNFGSRALNETDASASEITALKNSHSDEGSLDNRRSRGLAWLGLERARESVGWLPANATLDDPSILEDADRQPRFEDIEPLLVEIHLDPRVVDENVLKQRKQRLLLLFFEFLGVWDTDVARQYNLPSELQQLYELSSVSCLQRQTINPREFGFPWLRPSTEMNSESLNVCFKMSSILAASSLEQASCLFTDDFIWQSTIGRLRFRRLTGSIERALANGLITAKAALSLWRGKAKSLLSTSIQAQSDLSLWLAYAKGLVQTACAIPENNSLIFNEARKVFTSTLRMYPVPAISGASTGTSLREQLTVLLPRLKIVHASIEFELGVSFPLDLTHNLCRRDCFARALHLVQYAALGGPFIPLEQEEGRVTSMQGDAFANIVTLLVQRLEILRRLLPLSTDETSPSSVHSIADLAAILASLLLYLQLLTSGEDKLKSICGMIFPALQSIDNNGNISGAERPKAGYGSRRFLRLALSAISTVCVLSQRNHARLTETFLRLMSESFDTDALPLLTSPLEWTHLLPFKVAANCGAFVSKTCSIEYQRSLQGLLPPLILSSLESRLVDSVYGVCRSVALHLTDTCHHSTMRPRRSKLFDLGVEDAKGVSNPIRLLGLPSEQQTELMARLLPSSLDLLCIGLELEHWTSLVSSAADNPMTNSLSHCWVRGAVPRIRSAFEKALGSSSPSSSTNPMLRYGACGRDMPSLALTMTPSIWADHLRIVIWSAYMAFEWTLAGVSASDSPSSTSNVDAHRKQRTAFKAIFYRAVADLPWAKVLYTNLARYCPEDVEEVVDLLTSKELRLRTFMEEVDLLLISKHP